MDLSKVRNKSIGKIDNLRHYDKTQNQRILEEFVESNMVYAELVGYPHNSAKSCYNSISQSIHRYGIHGVKCATRKNKVYLIKTDKATITILD